MSQLDNQEYYRLRRDDARQAAEEAANDKVKAVHMEMADRYDTLLKSPEQNRRILGIRAA